jgi:hypothetical protein
MKLPIMIRNFAKRRGRTAILASYYDRRSYKNISIYSIDLPGHYQRDGMPPDAKWTKIDRRLVNPAALEAGKERFEAREDFVIVLRILTKEDIEAYAIATQTIRFESLES